MTKDKSCFHKIAKIAGAAGSLESHFLAAMAAKPTPLARLHVDVSGALFHTINSYRVANKTLHCGTLMRYTQGQHQLAVELDPKAHDLPIEQIAAAAPNAAKKKEFLDGISFFGIQGNHVTVIQSKGGLISDLAHHLSWLLSSTAGKTVAVELADYEPPAQKARRVSDIKKLSLISALESVPTKAAAAVDNGARKGRNPAKADVVNVVAGATWDAVKAIFKQCGAPVPAEVEFKGPLSPKDIEVKVELRWKRRGTNERERVLETLARALDGSDNLDYEMEFNDNSRRRGRQLKLITELPILVVDGVPQPSSAYEQMVLWLQKLIADESVPAKV